MLERAYELLLPIQQRELRSVAATSQAKQCHPKSEQATNKEEVA